MTKIKTQESFLGSIGSAFAGLNNSKYFSALVMILLKGVKRVIIKQ